MTQFQSLSLFLFSLIVIFLTLRSAALIIQKLNLASYLKTAKNTDDMITLLESLLATRMAQHVHLPAIKLTKAENEMEIIKLIGANLAKYIEGKWSFKICSAFQKEQKFIPLLESSPYVIFIEARLREIHPKEFRGISEKIDISSINNLELEVSSLETLSKIVKIHSLGEIFSLLDKMKDFHDELLFREFANFDKPYTQYEKYEKRMYRNAGIERMGELLEKRVRTT